MTSKTRVRIVVHQQRVDDLKRDRSIREDAERRAERVAERARADAPILTGDYRDSIHVEEDRDGYRVVAGTDHALVVEADTGNLVRALDAGR